jgi:hypothetical protein
MSGYIGTNGVGAATDAGAPGTSPGGCPECARLRAEVADLTRKGKDLCSQQETAELMEDAARRRADALFAENARLRAALEAEAVEHERQAKVWSGEGEALAEYHRERAAMLRKTLAGGKEGKA